MWGLYSPRHQAAEVQAGHNDIPKAIGQLYFRARQIVHSIFRARRGASFPCHLERKKLTLPDQFRESLHVPKPTSPTKRDTLIWADHYRLKALEYLSRANTASDDLQEARFLYLAQRYLKLAEAEEFAS
jgi:hypothetical protein